MRKDFSKLIEIKKLKKICDNAKREGKIIVFTNGCFDIIHPGHIECLQKAKQLGDILIVGLNTDNSVKRIKNNSRPIFNEKARITILSAIQWVDYIVLFDELTPQKLIETLSPDILVKGGDYKKGTVVGRTVVKNVVIIPLVKGYSTTEIINKIKEEK
jgi:rfaE bifunctional protein nucleotidyltransferase chain/domain